MLGLSQIRIKKLYAYSTITHIGYILIALIINSTESMKSFIFYLIQYSLVNLNIFIILYSMGYLIFSFKNENLIDKFNSPLQYIYQFKGCFYLHPLISISLGISLFSFIGIPPLVGFYGKQLILSAALDTKKYFLVLLVIITSVISAVYYLNLIKQKFFFKPKKFVIFVNLKLGLNIKDYILYTYGLNKIFFENYNKKNNNYIGKNIIRVHTINSSLSLIIGILSLLTLLYVNIHGEFITFINVISIYYS
jgi:NADH-ubiquinone oxidoreductase chain 2